LLDCFYKIHPANKKISIFQPPNHGLGLKSTLKTKTNVLVSNNFLDALPPKGGGIQETPYYKNVPFL